MTMDATAPTPQAATRPGPSGHAPHRFWNLAVVALVASALAWVALFLWGGGREMRRGLLTGGATLMSDAGHADTALTGMSGMAGMADMAAMPGMDMSHGGMSMLGVSMTGKEPASLGYGALFLWMWAVMILAMMLPAIVPSVRAFLDEDSSGKRSAGTRFLAAVTLVWVVVGVAVYGVLVLLDEVLPTSGRVAVTVGAIAILLAGLFQFSRTKERALAHVSGPFCCGGGPWRSGLDHGRRCVVSCGPYMAAVALIGMMNLFWMALFALVMVVEQVLELRSGKGVYLARGVGAVVVLIALGLLLVPGPLPLVA